MIDLSRARWKKSSRSGGNGGQCVEVALVPDIPTEAWRKSSRSGGNGGQCVEVASVPEQYAVRDSKNQHGPVLLFGQTPFSAFRRAAKAGEFGRS